MLPLPLGLRRKARLSSLDRTLTAGGRKIGDDLSLLLTVNCQLAVSDHSRANFDRPERVPGLGRNFVNVGESVKKLVVVGND